MNTLSEISNKIILCSQNDQLEIIVSLRAFLFDNPIHFWILFNYEQEYETNLIKLQNLNLFEAKSLNEKNINKIGLKPIDLFLLPKNKKNFLIIMIDEILNDLECKIIFDKLRTNPFNKDDLFIFIDKNKEFFSKQIYILYKNRNIQSKILISKSGIEYQIYDSCFAISRKNKIINYWLNSWGEKSYYNEPDLIENLILK